MNSVEHLSRACNQKPLGGRGRIVGNDGDALGHGAYPRTRNCCVNNCGVGSPSWPAPVRTRLLQLGKFSQGPCIRDPIPWQHPHVETVLPHSVTASFDWIVHWRESLRDGVYSVPGFLIIPAEKSSARFVGHRPGAGVRWQANRHLWLQADYGMFYAGKFVKESQSRRNLNYWALWAGYKF